MSRGGGGLDYEGEGSGSQFYAVGSFKYSPHGRKTVLTTQGVNQLAQGKLYLKLNILTNTSENRGQRNITEFNKFI